MRVGEYIQALQAEGILDSEGCFTVSLSEARAKLRSFRSSDDSRFLLHLVAACHGAGAERIVIKRSPTQIHLSAPGAHFLEEDLIAAYTHFFRLQHQTVASELVMGIVMAQALEAEEVTLLSRQQEGPSFRWRLEEAEEGSEQAAFGQTRFEFEAQFGSALGAWLLGLVSGQTCWRDCQWLESLCTLSRIPISVNGRSLNRPFQPFRSPVMLRRGANLPLQAPHAHVLEEVEQNYAATLAPGSGPLYLVVRGVQYPGPEVNLTGVVYCDRLRLDLSLEKVVQDAVYAELVTELKRRYDDLLCACDLKQAGPQWAIPYLPRLVQLAVQGRIGLPEAALLADWLEEEAPVEWDRAHDELALLSKVVRFHESQGDPASHREMARKAYARARHLIAERYRFGIGEVHRSLGLADSCAWLAAAHGHSSAPSWRLLGAGLALEKRREARPERLRELLVEQGIPRGARLFLRLGLWALQQAAGNFREGATTRREILSDIKSLSDPMARREVTALLKESPELVRLYAAGKLRHFASYDPELRTNGKGAGQTT